MPAQLVTIQICFKTYDNSIGRHRETAESTLCKVRRPTPQQLIRQIV
jgi:hypothetical protein